MKKMIILLSILVLLFAITAVYAGPIDNADDPFAAGILDPGTEIVPSIPKCPIYSSPRDGYFIPNCPVK
jgi:hypothetical protein